jgi:hypothetical protein
MMDNFERNVATCPFCDSEYLHQIEVEVFFREEDTDKGSHTTITRDASIVKSDQTGNPSPRRDGVRVWMKCEQCQRLSWVDIYQHKGQTFLRQDIESN